MSELKPQLIVALDADTRKEALVLVDSLAEVVDIFKVGSQLFTACGPDVVKDIIKRGKKVFLDLKFHDIPNTVAYSTSGAVVFSASVSNQVTHHLNESPGLYMCTVHTSGGKEMLVAAVKAGQEKAKELNVIRPWIVGVTVLTSEEKNDDIQKIVLERARLAKDCGLDGVVASPQEVKLIRNKLGKNFIIVTPGIPSSGDDAGDQKRIATPREAIKNGSNFLVVGRPILQAENPLQVTKQILAEINKRNL